MYGSCTVCGNGADRAAGRQPGLSRVPLGFFFRDPDGNQFMIVENESR